MSRNPDWTTDEHILALDLYLSCKPAQPQKGSKAVRDLSALLNRLHRKLGTQGLDTLRNADGVYMKLMNLKAHDPEYVAQGRKGLQRGNRLEAQVWAEYGRDPVRLHAVAGTVRSFIESDMPVPPVESDEDDGELEREGRLLSRVHRTYERNPKNRKRKVAQFRRAHGGRVYCESCGFDFERTYGNRGEGFIECHHGIPVSQLKPNQRIKLSDLHLLCSNCHRMMHRRPMLGAADELSQVIAATMTAEVRGN